MKIYMHTKISMHNTKYSWKNVNVTLELKGIDLVNAIDYSI